MISSCCYCCYKLLLLLGLLQHWNKIPSPEVPSMKFQASSPQPNSKPTLLKSSKTNQPPKIKNLQVWALEELCFKGVQLCEHPERVQNKLYKMLSREPTKKEKSKTPSRASLFLDLCKLLSQKTKTPSWAQELCFNDSSSSSPESEREFRSLGCPNKHLQEHIKTAMHPDSCSFSTN